MAVALGLGCGARLGDGAFDCRACVVGGDGVVLGDGVVVGDGAAAGTIFADADGGAWADT
ncbi:hypothetical protein G9E11_05695 [Arthrobacter sp. IA7]|uniref:hypothetical protein n=1 Tax=Arthrobacter ipis TaxID=2716202 RepID=UPI001687A533|nr:hypothetical protein [Arthrobacter ipis]MBD1541750.1 hypothetical protein [Arthrobacter ipis]